MLSHRLELKKFVGRFMFALDEHMSAKIRASYSEPVSNI
jgi:hypothetical protein